jgi:hypothetical protein
MLPYWTIIRLTGGGVLRWLRGLLELGVGGGLLVLALFGLLPSGATGPAAAIGGAWLLAAVGYAALRSGTMLHGLVLLSPVLPLAVVAINRSQTSFTAQATKNYAITGVIALGGVVLVVVALGVLGSMPRAARSPLSTLYQWATRRRVALLFGRLLGMAALAVLVWLAARHQLYALRWLDPPAWATIAATTAAILFGMISALSGGRSIERWRRRDGMWDTEFAEPPGAALAGWAVVYGACYLVVAAALLVFRPRYGGWEAVLATALLFGLVLLLVTSWLLTSRARRAIVTSLVAQAIPSRYHEVDDVPEVFLTHLYSSAQLYRFLVFIDGGAIRLRPQGVRVAKRIQAKVRRHSLTTGWTE